jgi:hypothetical protein
MAPPLKEKMKIQQTSNFNRVLEPLILIECTPRAFNFNRVLEPLIHSPYPFNDDISCRSIESNVIFHSS